MLLNFICIPSYFCFAETEEDVVYQILDENYIEINSSYNVNVGDMFISDDNMLYEIYLVDDEIFVAYARVVEKVTLPKVEEKNTQIIQVGTHVKRIGMYHTHNDESYVLGDGYESVYGEGGIMDIGDELARELKKHNITVYQNDALHLPHDSRAYVRSKTTAQNLLNKYELDAIFDVHRDGVPRKQFLGEINGHEMSKIRMVVGKSNPNYEKNLEFAKAIKAYADKKYPGLIKDIYMGSGNYNQNLSKTSMLFEMGTYLIEKDYVKSSIPYLADTIDKVMYTDAIESPDGESFGENSIKEENNFDAEINVSPENKEEVSPATKLSFVSAFLVISIGVGVWLILKTLKAKKGKK